MRRILLVAFACAHSTPAVTPPASPSPAPSVAEPTEPTPNPDYAALKAFHHYYRILSVGPYLEHWRAWYIDNELVRGYLTAAPDGSGATFVGYDWGLDESEHHDDFPAAQAATAARVRAAVKAHEKKDAFAVAYLGTYREVAIEELVPHDEPGDPEKRMAASRTLTLAVDDAMTKVIGGAGEVDGGSDDNRLCWIRIRDCGAAPYWIDARPDREGHPRAWDIANPASDVPDATRAAFDAAVVAAAAQYASHAPGPALGALAVSQGDALLPDDLDDTILVGLDAERGDVQSYVTVPLSLSAALAGEARGSIHFFFGGRNLGLTATLTVTAPAGAHGKVDLTGTLRFRVSGAADATEHTAKLAISAIVDGTRAMPLEARGDPGFDEKLPDQTHLAVHLHAPE